MRIDLILESSQAPETIAELARTTSSLLTRGRGVS